MHSRLRDRLRDLPPAYRALAFVILSGIGGAIVIAVVGGR